MPAVDAAVVVITSYSIHYTKLYEVHLLDYLYVVQRRWRVALLIFILVFGGVALKTFLQTPLYQADVILRTGAKPETGSEILDRARPGYFSIDSELQVLQSYAVAEKAAKKLSYPGDVMTLVTTGVRASEMGVITSYSIHYTKLYDSIKKNVRVDLPIVGDLRDVLTKLLKELGGHDEELAKQGDIV